MAEKSPRHLHRRRFGEVQGARAGENSGQDAGEHREAEERGQHEEGVHRLHELGRERPLPPPTAVHVVHHQSECAAPGDRRGQGEGAVQRQRVHFQRQGRVPRRRDGRSQPHHGAAGGPHRPAPHQSGPQGHSFAQAAPGYRHVRPGSGEGGAFRVHLSGGHDCAEFRGVYF